MTHQRGTSPFMTRQRLCHIGNACISSVRLLSVIRLRGLQSHNQSIRVRTPLQSSCLRLVLITSKSADNKSLAQDLIMPCSVP